MKTAKQIIQYIANDIPELSAEKIANQRDEYKKICKEWMKEHWEDDTEWRTTINYILTVNKTSEYFDFINAEDQIIEFIEHILEDTKDRMISTLIKQFIRSTGENIPGEVISSLVKEFYK